MLWGIPGCSCSGLLHLPSQTLRVTSLGCLSPRVCSMHRDTEVRSRPRTPVRTGTPAPPRGPRLCCTLHSICCHLTFTNFSVYCFVFFLRQWFLNQGLPPILMSSLGRGRCFWQLMGGGQESCVTHHTVQVAPRTEPPCPKCPWCRGGEAQIPCHFPSIWNNGRPMEGLCLRHGSKGSWGWHSVRNRTPGSSTGCLGSVLALKGPPLSFVECSQIIMGRID